MLNLKYHSLNTKSHSQYTTYYSLYTFLNKQTQFSKIQSDIRRYIINTYEGH
jgi:hypothetical protein